MGKVELVSGVTVSSGIVVDLARYGLLSNQGAHDLEIVLRSAAEDFARRYGISPFMGDQGDYFRALELVTHGHPLERVVALYSQPIVRVETEDYDNANSAAGSYLIKPSRDPKDRVSVNHRFRVPADKLRSHRSPKESLHGTREIEYGRRFIWVPAKRAKEFFAPRSDGYSYSDDIGAVISEHALSSSHLRALAKLLVVLRAPYEIPERHGRLIEALEDLERFPRSVLPERGIHNNLMSDLRAAVTGNKRLDVRIIPPEYRNGIANLGYLVRQL